MDISGKHRWSFQKRHQVISGPDDYLLSLISVPLGSFDESHKLFLKKSDAVVNLVGSGRKATPSQRNGSYRPGKPLFDQRSNYALRVAFV